MIQKKHQKDKKHRTKEEEKMKHKNKDDKDKKYKKNKDEENKEADKNKNKNNKTDKSETKDKKELSDKHTVENEDFKYCIICGKDHVPSIKLKCGHYCCLFSFEELKNELSLYVTIVEDTYMFNCQKCQKLIEIDQIFVKC